MLKRFFFRLLFLVIILFGSVYAYESYQASQGTDSTMVVHTQKEQNIQFAEDGLTRTERLARIFRTRSAVEEAMDKRVPKKERVDEDSISIFMKEAMVATEDRRFYEHGAMDPRGSARATYTNLIHGETLEGGSTITQQLVKNLFLSSKRIMSRKVEEGALAIQVEREYTKDQILTMYLNTIYFGNDYYGIKAAAKGYFHTTPGRLTLAQSAMLAGLPQAPTYFHPKANYKEATHQQVRVLKQMYEQGIISGVQLKDAIDEDLGFAEDEKDM